MKKFIVFLCAISLLLGVAGIAGAVPIKWSGNNHYYDIVHFETDQTWMVANTEAGTKTYLGMQGHLATLTSAAENSWVASNFFPNHTYWLGGYQFNKDDEPSGNWAWVTGETWSYQNWSGGEPNDEGGDEDHLQFWSDDDTWNDMHNYWEGGGYIIEYEGAPIPEPATMLLLGSGLVGLAGFRRKKK